MLKWFWLVDFYYQFYLFLNQLDLEKDVSTIYNNIVCKKKELHPLCNSILFDLIVRQKTKNEGCTPHWAEAGAGTLFRCP